LIPKLTEDQTFTGNPRRECVQWLGQELSSVQAALPDTHTILQQLSDEAGGLWYVLHAIETALSERHASATAFLEGLTRGGVAAAATEVIQNIEAKDGAPDDSPMVMLIFILTHGNANDLRDAIALGVREGRFSVEDVAARCVTIAYSSRISEDGEIVGFQDDVFRQLVSDDLLMAFAPGPTDQFNERDVSWSARRATANDVLVKLQEQLQATRSTVGAEAQADEHHTEDE
jgi:hypothetical protein